MVQFTIRIDETAGTLLEIETHYGKFIAGGGGEPIQVCQHGTAFEARIAERMLLGAVSAVRIKTPMRLYRDGGRLELFNEPQDLNSSD